MTLRLSEQDDHTEDLLSWMQTAIAAVRGDYRAAKATIADSVGYENEGAHFSFTLKGPVDEIVDWELGLRRDPPITSLEVTQRRFGIKLPHPLMSQGIDRVRIEPNGQPCLVSLRNRAEGTNVTLSGKLFRSGLGLPGNRLAAWRANFGCLNLIWRGGVLRGSFDPSSEGRLALPILLDRMTICDRVPRGGVAFLDHLAFRHQPGPIMSRVLRTA